MEKIYKISGIKFINNRLEIKIDEHKYSFDINDISKKLAGATEEEKNDYRISSSGYGIHWLSLDEDISIPGLLNSNSALYGKKEIKVM